MSEDLYKRENYLKKCLARVRDSEELPSDNKLAILKFYQNCVAEGLSVGRLAKYLHSLSVLSSMLGKEFGSASRDDIIGLVEKIEQNSKWAEATKQYYKVTLKKFYRWSRRIDIKGVYPEEVAWIRTTLKDSRRVLPSEILTEEEIGLLARAATNPRDKAMVCVLYESGCRAGEFLTLRIRQVSFDDYGAVLMVTGKTGQRRVRIIASAPALANWLENHPSKDDGSSHLWISLATNYKDQPLNHRGLYETLKTLARKAGITKKVNPHAFRHARATHLANKLTEQQLKAIFGWTQGSEMASVYVHLSGRDVDNALLELHGLTTQAKSEPKFKIKICPRCDERNSPDAKYCKRCALTLDAEALELEDKLMNELVGRPQVARYLRKALREVLVKRLR